MNIIEATKEARERRAGIRNTLCKKCNVYILPTSIGYYMFHSGAKEDSCIEEPKPRWNHKADDIIQDDWELYNPSSEQSTESKLPSFQAAEGITLPETGILEIQPENKITLNFNSIYDWTKDVASGMTVIDQFKEKYPDIGIDIVMNFSRTDKF